MKVIIEAKEGIDFPVNLVLEKYRIEVEKNARKRLELREQDEVVIKLIKRG